MFLRAGIFKAGAAGALFCHFVGTGTASYRIESVAAVDVRGGSVAAVFECLIPGREGRGVDVVRVADGKVVAVDALRF